MYVNVWCIHNMFLFCRFVGGERLVERQNVRRNVTRRHQTWSGSSQVCYTHARTHAHQNTHTHTHTALHTHSDKTMAFQIKLKHFSQLFLSFDLPQNLAIYREIPAMLGIADFVFRDKTTWALSSSDIQALSVLERNSLGLRINSLKSKRLFTLSSQTLWFVGFFRQDVSTVWWWVFCSNKFPELLKTKKTSLFI